MFSFCRHLYRVNGIKNGNRRQFIKLVNLFCPNSDETPAEKIHGTKKAQ